MNVKDMKDKTLELIGKYKYLLIVIAAGIILIIIPTTGIDVGAEQSKEASLPIQVFSVEEEERRIESLLREIEKVGEVKVMLTLKSSVETVFAEEKSGSVSRKQDQGEVSSYDQEQSSKPALVSEGSGVQDALTVKYIYPEYQGVLVVCEGAGHADVRLNISESLSALLGIGTDKITIAKMKN